MVNGVIFVLRCSTIWREAQSHNGDWYFSSFNMQWYNSIKSKNKCRLPEPLICTTQCFMDISIHLSSAERRQEWRQQLDATYGGIWSEKGSETNFKRQKCTHGIEIVTVNIIWKINKWNVRKITYFYVLR